MRGSKANTRKSAGSPNKKPSPTKPKKRNVQLDTEIEPSQAEIASPITRSKTHSTPTKKIKTDPGTPASSKQTTSVGYPKRRIWNPNEGKNDNDSSEFNKIIRETNKLGKAIEMIECKYNKYKLVQNHNHSHIL